MQPSLTIILPADILFQPNRLTTLRNMLTCHTLSLKVTYEAAPLYVRPRPDAHLYARPNSLSIGHDEEENHR